MSGAVAAALIASLASGPPSTSYANAGGTGDRTASITVTSSGLTINAGVNSSQVDGTTASGGINYAEAPGAGAYVRFDFGSGVKKYIDEAKYYTSAVADRGSWKWRGSNDASSWTDLGTTLWDSTTKTFTLSGMDNAGYRYYQLEYVSGGASMGAFYYETEFKIAPGA